MVGSPLDGCQPLTSTVGAKGSIIVLERGACMFALKVCCLSSAKALLDMI